MKRDWMLLVSLFFLAVAGSQGYIFVAATEVRTVILSAIAAVCSAFACALWFATWLASRNRR